MHFLVKDVRLLITHPTCADLLSDVATHLADGRGFALATLNLDHLVKLRRNDAFRAAYAAQDMVVADGNPIVWLCALGGQTVALVPGSDMVVPLLERAAAADVPVAFFGSTDAALEQAAARLSDTVPGLRVVLRLAPPMGFDPAGLAADAYLDQIAASGAGLCMVALGAPKQEIFAARGRTRAPAVGFASIGAGLDFHAGTQKRAPRWVRRIAMEWAWRMMGNPGRLVQRYAECALILPGEALSALRQRGDDTGAG